MKELKHDLEASYAARRKRIIKQIKDEAALFCAAPLETASRDQHFPYRPNSDFYYLTGFNEPEAALLLLGSARGPRSILWLRDRDPLAERWQGERLGIKRGKKRFKVDEVRNIAAFATDLAALLRESSVLHYSPGTGGDTDALVWKLFQTPLGPRSNFPHTLKDARLMMSEMRFVKDRLEIRALKHVADITAQSFVELFRRIKEVSSEAHGASLLESFFVKFGATGTAFQTIVAAGRNATCLHHRPQLQPLWRRELALVDAGAAYRGYCADITRTVPVSGKFSPPQADVYDVVHGALQKAVERARPGASLSELHESAVEVITEGLVGLKVLKGPVPQLIAAGKYKRFYMHRTSHWLGLDVHDIAPLAEVRGAGTESTYLRPLVPGNVFTVEPGLYFDPRDSSVPKHFRGIGIRVEDDVLITEAASEVLMAGLPSERTAVESLLT